MNPEKRELLSTEVRHLDITICDPSPLIEAFDSMAFQARNLASAARIYDRMLADRDCGIILTLAGSLCSAGLKDLIVRMIEDDMVDAVVSTGPSGGATEDSSSHSVSGNRKTRPSSACIAATSTP